MSIDVVQYIIGVPAGAVNGPAPIKLTPPRPYSIYTDVVIANFSPYICILTGINDDFTSYATLGPGVVNRFTYQGTRGPILANFINLLPGGQLPTNIAYLVADFNDEITTGSYPITVNMQQTQTVQAPFCRNAVALTGTQPAGFEVSLGQANLQCAVGDLIVAFATDLSDTFVPPSFIPGSGLTDTDPYSTWTAVNTYNTGGGVLAKSAWGLLACKIATSADVGATDPWTFSIAADAPEGVAFTAGYFTFGNAGTTTGVGEATHTNEGQIDSSMLACPSLTATGVSIAVACLNPWGNNNFQSVNVGPGGNIVEIPTTDPTGITGLIGGACFQVLSPGSTMVWATQWVGTGTVTGPSNGQLGQFALIPSI